PERAGLAADADLDARDLAARHECRVEADRAVDREEVALAARRDGLVTVEPIDHRREPDVRDAQRAPRDPSRAGASVARARDEALRVLRVAQERVACVAPEQPSFETAERCEDLHAVGAREQLALRLRERLRDGDLLAQRLRALALFLLGAM